MQTALPARTGVLVGSFAVAVLLAPLPHSAAAPPPARAGSSAAEGSAGATVNDVRVAEASRVNDGAWAVRTEPEPVTGFGLVGVTWAGETPEGLRLSVRSRADGAWSSWTALAVDQDGPGSDPATPGSDPAASGSATSASARAGTAPFPVGEVDAVQLRASGQAGEQPDDLRLSVIDPGPDPAGLTAGRPTGQSVAAMKTRRKSEQEPAVKPGVRAPRPAFFRRGDWGADARLRSGRPSYGRVKVGFVHHTVNSNDYRRRDVPSIIRGIYAYHTLSRGWSDIGYNFLVDKFGRIWVGRAGGPRRPVMGAHVYGYNHLSTGISVIGNFVEKKPRRQVLRVLGRMMGWKLGLAGIGADERKRIDGKAFHAINGHRDAGSTACPGDRLYARLPKIREIAVRWQTR